MADERLYTVTTKTNPMLYKEFFRMYYKENLKTMRIITTISGIVLIILAAFIFANDLGPVWAFLSAWIGAVLLVYPRNAFRKPYRQMKGNIAETKFDFFEDYMTEKCAGQKEKYSYSDMDKIIEKGQYIYLFHDKNSVSVIDKTDMKDDGAKSLAKFLKSKAKYIVKK